MAQKIQIRRDTAANWTTANPLLAQGEPGHEIDTGKVKFGNGIDNWNSLIYQDLTGSSWTQTGSGAVTRTVDEKLKDVVSVKDFGAVGDGVADDTAAIQNAINSSAKAIYFPPGTYNHTGLSLARLKRYFGAGRSSSFLVHTGSGGNALEYIGSASAQLQIEDLNIAGNETNTANTIYIANGNFVTFISRCNIHGGIVNIFLRDSWTATIDDCWVYGNAPNNPGVTQTNIYTDGWETGVIYNCRIEDCLEDNIVIDKNFSAFVSQGFVISGQTKIQRCGRYGIHAKGANSWGTITAYFEAVNQNNTAGLAAIKFDSGGYSKVSGCYMTNSGANSAFIDFTGNSLVVDSCHQSSSGGATGLIVQAGTNKVTTIGNRFFVTTPYSVNSGVKFVNLDQESKINFVDDSLLLGDRANVDSTDYIIDAYTTSKNLRFNSTTNSKVFLNSPANRRLEIVLQSGGVDKWFVGRGRGDEPFPDDFYIGNISGGSSTPAFRVNGSTNRVFLYLPGPFADDAAAATNNVAINQAYRKTGGTVAWRVS